MICSETDTDTKPPERLNNYALSMNNYKEDINNVK